MALHEVQLKGYSVRPGNLSLGTFDSYGIEQLHVTADDSWDGLDILAVFHAPNGDAKKVVVGADGMLNVPPEATAKQAGNGRIVFVGLAENVQRITVDMGYNIKPHSDIEGDNPGVPTPDVVQQILQAALNAEQNSAEANSVADGLRNDAANGKFNGKDGAKGDKGETGITPQLKIGKDNLWQVSYDNGATWVSLGVKATGDAGKDGKNGLTPHIGKNGNWWLGDTDTGVSAKGPKGDPGPQGPAGEIPEDYPQIREDVSKLKEDTAALKKRQNVLVGSETGNPASCNDAFAAPLCGLTVYGKSTQDGTPTPDAPVPIVSAGDSGSVAVRLAGANLVEGTKSGNTGSVSGISYTANKDGISFIGNADTALNIYLHNDIKEKLTPGVYYLTTKGLSASVSINFYQVGAFNNDVQNKEIRVIAGKEYTILLAIAKGAAVNGLVVQVSLTRNKITTYSPYREQLLTLPTPNGLHGISVPAGGNYTDQNGQQWVCDEVDLERGVKVQRVESRRILSSEVKDTLLGVNSCYIIEQNIARPANNRQIGHIMCTHLERNSWNRVVDNGVQGICETGDQPYIGITMQGFKSVNEYKDFMNKNEVGIAHELATPIETPLTPAEIAAYKALTAYAPDTVVQASDGAGIKLDYQRDVNLVVKNLEDAIASMTTTT